MPSGPSLSGLSSSDSSVSDSLLSDYLSSKGCAKPSIIISPLPLHAGVGAAPADTSSSATIFLIASLALATTAIGMLIWLHRHTMCSIDNTIAICSPTYGRTYP